MSILKESLLSDWLETDIVLHYLALSMGLVEEGNSIESFDSFRANKALYWSNNPVGNMLSKLLYDMEDIGALESKEEGTLWRWNQDFNWEEV